MSYVVAVIMFLKHWVYYYCFIYKVMGTLGYSPVGG